MSGVSGQSAVAATAAERALSLSSLSGNVGSSNVMPSRFTPLDAVRQQQTWPVRPPLPPPNALQSVVQLPPPLRPPSYVPSTLSYWNLRPEARFSVPRASNTVRVSTVRGVSFQDTPSQLSVPRGDFGVGQSDYQRQQQVYQQQQQLRPAYSASSQNQLISLVIHHCRLTEHFLRQMEIALNSVVNDLSRATARMNAPSPFLRRVCDLLKSLSDEENAIRWQYRIEYMRAYNVLVAKADPGRAGLTRINGTFVSENLRVVLMCSMGLETATLELRSCLLSLTNCRQETTEAAIMLHISEFRYFFDSFKEALVAYTTHAFCRPLLLAATEVENCSQSQPVPDFGTTRTSTFTSQAGSCRQLIDGNEEHEGSVQEAFSNDVDRLISEQHQERQPVTDTLSTYLQPDSVSTSAVVDQVSDVTRLLDTRVSCCVLMQGPATLTTSTNTAVYQIEPIQATSTSTTGVGMAVSEPSEVKFSNVLQSRRDRQTELGCITIDSSDDELAGLQPCPVDEGELTSACVTDVTAGVDYSYEVRVASAVDLMSLGGFGLFVPFYPAASCQPAEEPQTVETAEVLSNVGDCGITVKQEPTDVVEHPLLPADDVVSERDVKTENTSSSDWLADVTDVGDDSDLICRIERVFSVPPDVHEATETSLLSSDASSQLPVPTSSEKQPAKKVPTTGHRDASPEHHEHVPTPVSSTLQSSSKIVAVDVRSSRIRRLSLRTFERNGTVYKRKTSDSTDDNTRKAARNVDDQKLTSGRRMPVVVPVAKESNTWVFQKKLIIAPPPPPPAPAAVAVKRRPGRPPKRRMDTLVMPSPAELRRRPEARRKILALYRSAQFTPLDGSKRKNLAVLAQRSSVVGTQSLKAAAERNVSASESRPSDGDRRKAPAKKFTNKKLDAKQTVSIGNDAGLSLADYSVKQSVGHSASVAEPAATTHSNASSAVSAFRGDQGQKVASSAMKVSSVNMPAHGDLRAASQQVDGNNSTLTVVEVHSAGETTTATASRRGLYVTDSEENRDDDDECEDRLVIDLDHADPSRSESEYSALSDHCSNRENNEKNSPSTNHDEVTTASDKQPRPDFRLNTTFGNHVMSSSTSFSPLPIYTYTSDKYNSRPIVTYSDISEDENNNECVTSWIAGARTSSHDVQEVDHQPVVQLSTRNSSGVTAVDVAEPLVSTSQAINHNNNNNIATFMTPTQHPQSDNVNQNLEYTEVSILEF